MNATITVHAQMTARSEVSNEGTPIYSWPRPKPLEASPASTPMSCSLGAP